MTGAVSAVRKNTTTSGTSDKTEKNPRLESETAE